MALTPLQKRFCEEYIDDLNATQAAIRAGYSPRSARQMASENLSKHDIQDEIQRLKDERSERVRLRADEVLAELKILVHSDIDHFSLGDNGRLVVSPDALPGARRAVARKRLKRRALPARGDAEGGEEFEADISLWDKPAAIRMALEHLGISKKPTLEALLEFFPPSVREATRRFLAGHVPDGGGGPADGGEPGDG